MEQRSWVIVEKIQGPNVPEGFGQRCQTFLLTTTIFILKVTYQHKWHQLPLLLQYCPRGLTWYPLLHTFRQIFDYWLMCHFENTTLISVIIWLLKYFMYLRWIQSQISGNEKIQSCVFLHVPFLSNHIFCIQVEI